jgi:hypothetical protein
MKYIQQARTTLNPAPTADKYYITSIVDGLIDSINTRKYKINRSTIY